LKEIHEISKEYSKYFVGLGKFPLEVKLEKVSYVVPVDLSASKIETVFNSSFLYSLVKFCKRIYNREPRPQKIITQFPVLKNINLVLQPGKQYLVLGAPGSGKTSLLKLIAGLIKPTKNETLEGNIEYNGRTLKEKEEFHIENAIAYIDQLDKHAPRLTVEETFEFAYQCLTGGQFVRAKLEGGKLCNTNDYNNGFHGVSCPISKYFIHFYSSPKRPKRRQNEPKRKIWRHESC
jgi:ABC-type multidrug transport system ATPase subunit